MKKASRIKIVGCLMVPFLIVAFGCGGSKVVKQNQAMAEQNKPVVYEKTGTTQRPEWTNQFSYSEDDRGYHFTGGVMGGADYALTIRMAKSEAIKNLLESIEIKARSEFSSVMHGNYGKDESLGRYVTDAVAWTVENLKVSGIRQQAIYYEQHFDPVSQRTRYNAWVNLEIGKVDYLKARVGAAERLLKKAIREKDEEAKEKALELLEKLRTEA
jgi:hypothetical protein